MPGMGLDGRRVPVGGSLPKGIRKCLGALSLACADASAGKAAEIAGSLVEDRRASIFSEA